MAFTHEPVLAKEVIRYLAPRAGGRYVDATVGGGGHAEVILEASAPSGRLLGIDRDPDAIEAAKTRLAPYADRVTLTCDQYGRLPEILEELQYGTYNGSRHRVDGVLVDAGVSSHQLDSGHRGFSLRREGPLDMRMSQQGLNCAELLDELEVGELAKILNRYGDVPRSGRLAHRIKDARETGQLETTIDLATLVELASPPIRSGHIHPATLVFQALRIAVNGELDDLSSLCEAMPVLLRRGGVGVVISFHRLEDRIAKRAFRQHSTLKDVLPGVPMRESERGRPLAKLLTPHPVKADASEIEDNRRSRSACLRAIERLEPEEEPRA